MERYPLARLPLLKTIQEAMLWTLLCLLLRETSSILQEVLTLRAKGGICSLLLETARAGHPLSDHLFSFYSLHKSCALFVLAARNLRYKFVAHLYPGDEDA